LKIDAIAAVVTVDDDARAELAGTIDNYQLNYASSATVNNDNLKTYSSRKLEIEQPDYTRKHTRFIMHASL
jgi:hypothetical protein